MSRLVALLRNSWRQLTSMRTALVLLFLLAVASIPGSVLPQKDVNIEDVQAYVRDNPSLGRWLDRLWAFEVFSSPWFSAIYLLLFTSLVGCVVPRLRDHLRAVFAAPPQAPGRLERLPQHAAGVTGHGAPAEVAERIRVRLRARRWRAVARPDGGDVPRPDGGSGGSGSDGSGDGNGGSGGGDATVWTVSAEKGFLKETGNLLFHASLLAVLAGVAYGSWFGWHGNRLLVAGSDTAFCNTVQQFDEYGLGARVDDADLPGFCLELTNFKASYRETGQAESFRAYVDVQDTAGGTARTTDFSVNDPVGLDVANVYLFGHGYAPVIRYTDRYGVSQTVVAPFLPVDGMLTSEGAAKFPDANVDPATGEHDRRAQVGFEGLFLPTAPDTPPFSRSVFPLERSPALMLWAYRGDLGENAGIPGSVYRIDQRQVEAGRLQQVGQPKLLRVGESWKLDDGTTVEFLGTRQWITLSVRHDPGEIIVFGAVGVLLVGLVLSLGGRRRRIFFRVSKGDGTDALIEAGGLPRTDYPSFPHEFTQTVSEVCAHPSKIPPILEKSGDMRDIST